MADSVTLRPATPADQPLLERWDREPHVREAGIEDWPWAEELVAAPWRESFIAQLAGEPFGFLQIMDPAGDPGQYWGNVGAGFGAIDLWIGDPQRLGQGYGSQMLKQALALSFARDGVQAVLLDPLASNVRAHRFYRRFGFRFVEERWFDEDRCCVFRLDRADWEAPDVTSGRFRTHP
ncbi:MAG: GNAT family N-acetyltransferase [Pseudomonadota bacterium]